jgi:hypothetical protein
MNEGKNFFMKSKRAFELLVVTLAMGAISAAQTFTSHPIRIPGGSNVLVTGINDSGEMVANYTDSGGSAHCVMISGSTRTQIVDPNEVGTGPGKGTSCWGINNAGEIVGSYSAVTWGNGFTYSAGTYADVIVPSATAGTTAYGLNNMGQIVGSYADNTGQYGFLYTVSSGTYTSLTVPGATATLAVGINDSSIITFEWVNASFVFSGAVLKGSHYTILNVPGMSQSKARGINVHDLIVFNAQDSSGVWHGFLYKRGTFTQFDVANAANTYSFGINTAGQIVGGYNPSANPTTEIGFVGHL